MFHCDWFSCVGIAWPDLIKVNTLNSKRIVEEQEYFQPDLQPQTDVCNTSFGGLFGNLWFCATFDAVNILEFFKLLLAVMIWSISLQSQQICSHCENQALIHILNSGTSKCCHIMLLNDANVIWNKFKPHYSLLVHIIILLLVNNLNT